MLLCDLVIEHAKDLVRPGSPWKAHLGPYLQGTHEQFQGIANLLQPAVRYVIEPEVVEASCNVALSRPSSLKQAVSVLRVPHPVMWMEWQESSRDLIRKRLNLAKSGQPIPKRCGFLLLSDASGRTGKCYWVWSHEGEAFGRNREVPTVAFWGVEFDFDVIGRRPEVREKARASVNQEILGRWEHEPAEQEAWLDIGDACYFLAAPGSETFGRTMERYMDKTSGDMLMAQYKQDIAGEFAQVVSLLIMLQAKNGVTSRPGDDLARLNRKRTKQGKPPLLDHVVVNMRLSAGERKEAGRGGAVTLSSARRAHLVMGHYVTRGNPKPVIYWRRAHVRGGSTAPTTIIKLKA